LELRYPMIDIPELPAYGDLDIHKVKESTYFFH
jgi:DNA-directed RNA polymerase